MTKYKKGVSGNPKGRPRGSTNEKTKYIREWMISLIGSNAQNMAADFQNLPRKEKWRVITQLMPYILPKQSEAKVRANVNFEQLTDEQVDDIITQISNDISNDE